MVVNYGTHAETMYRSVVKYGGYEVTGDIPGAVSKLMETNAGGAPVVLFTSCPMPATSIPGMDWAAHPSSPAARRKQFPTALPAYSGSNPAVREVILFEK